MRLLLNEEQEEIDGDIQNVFFVRLFQCKSGLNLRGLHRRVAQTSFMDESVDSTRHGACLNQDFGMLVI